MIHKHPLSYGVITPVRNERENLERLAACLSRQTVKPSVWMIVDNGSTDDTVDFAQKLSKAIDWVMTHRIPAAAGAARGGPIVRAFHAGLAELHSLQPGVVVKLDADVSFEDDYFARLLDAFRADGALGIASGSGHELRAGEWEQIHTTGTSVWGAARAYRRECLQEVLPLEERMGWDGIDELKARASGWRTETIVDLPFFHHRREGERDGSAWRRWQSRGRAAHFMGYRPSYLALRTIHHACREPAALAMLAGYLGAIVTRSTRCDDRGVRGQLRRQQRLRNLPSRRRETQGRRPDNIGERADVLLVCSSGGHLLQLWSLRTAWEGYSRAWVVGSFEQSDVRSLLEGERVEFAHGPTARNVKNLFRNALLARRLTKQLRPALVLTTGSAVAVPFAWVGRLYGARVVYVESLARTTVPSLSCRLVAPIADRVYVQWPELREALPKARYEGTVFAGR